MPKVMCSLVFQQEFAARTRTNVESMELVTRQLGSAFATTATLARRVAINVRLCVISKFGLAQRYILCFHSRCTEFVNFIAVSKGTITETFVYTQPLDESKEHPCISRILKVIN